MLVSDLSDALERPDGFRIFCVNHDRETDDLISILIIASLKFLFQLLSQHASEKTIAKSLSIID